MFVLKRNGQLETLQFEKIQRRIEHLVHRPPSLTINVQHLAMKVIQGLYDRIPTSTIDTFTAQVAASLSTEHSDYGSLAARVVVNNHHKNTLASFSEKMIQLGKETTLLDESFV